MRVPSFGQRKGGVSPARPGPLSRKQKQLDRGRAVKKQLVKRDTQIVAQFLSEVDFLEWQNRTGQTKGQWNEVLSWSEHARKTLYRAAAEKALDGLRTGHLLHFFDVLTQYGPRLLAEPEVTQAVETWWLAKWRKDVASEYQEVNKRNLKRIGEALSWIGSRTGEIGACRAIVGERVRLAGADR